VNGSYGSCLLLRSPPLSERRYCDAWRHAVCVSAALVSAVKVMCCLFVCSGSKFSAISWLRCGTSDAPADTVPVGYVFLFC